MGTETDQDEDWKTIESKLPEDWRELGRRHGILARDPRRDEATGSGWQIRDHAVLLRMILRYVTTNDGLNATVAVAAALGLASITGSALHKWMEKTGDWLASMLTRMVDTAASFPVERWAGYEVISADATTVQMPGATSNTANVHFALRLFDLCAVGIKVTSHKVGESLRNFAIKAGQLWIADRGYCNANSIAHAVAAKADVLIRFHFTPLPLVDEKGAALNLRSAVLAFKRVGATKEWTVFVPNKGAPIRCRLIAYRLSEDQAKQSRERLYREHKKSDVSEAMLALSNYVVLITTVPSDRLSAKQLVELYRLRWQIELEFKRDKSIAGLDQLPSRLPATIHSWICAKLLALQLARRVAEPAEPFPPSVIGKYAMYVRPIHLAALAHLLRE